MMKVLWDFFSALKVNFWLLLIISLNLAIGAYYINNFPNLFNPLNFSLFQDWYINSGRPFPGRIWWFGTLLVLLFLLGINTFVCALKRLLQLWSRRKQLGTKIFFVKITPTFIHLSFLIILSGHLISLVIGYHQMVPLTSGLRGQLPGGITWQLIDQGCDKYSFPDSLKGSIRQCSVTLRLQDSKMIIMKNVAVLSPLRWAGYSFHLDLSGRKRGLSNAATPTLNLIIKDDPGLTFILSGFLVMCVFLVWYFPQRKNFKEVIQK
jgi:hypothetical protein